MNSSVYKGSLSSTLAIGGVSEGEVRAVTGTEKGTANGSLAIVFFGAQPFVDS